MPCEWNGPHVSVRPARAVSATVRPPGSKSLTNRYLLCAALADGASVLRGASLADDTRAMIKNLRRLEIRVQLRDDADLITLEGCGGYPPADQADLDVGNAGTTMRFLTGLLTLGQGRFRIDGSPRMRARPIGALVNALHSLGAGIGYDGREGYPPLSVLGRGLHGGEAHFRAPPSSQFLSALLMVAPYAARDVFIRIDGGLPSRPYVDMTIAVMRSMGVEALTTDATRFVVPSAQRYTPAEFVIEPDASAAGYLWSAAAITGGRVRVDGLTRKSCQGDVRFVDVLEGMGCRIDESENAIEVHGPPAGRLESVDVDLNAMPDAAQTLAVLALFADGPTRIKNVANLRIKETDRLAALQTELTRLGARVALHEDGLTIEPPKQITSAQIETYDDHRMAMSFALAGLRADGVVIKNADCVSKSFPNYFNVLNELSPT